MKTLAQLKATLKKAGYRYTDCYNVEHQGKTYAFRSPKNGGLHINAWVASQGGPDFWIMTLWKWFDPEPESRWWHPMVKREVDPLFEKHLHKLEYYENFVM